MATRKPKVTYNVIATAVGQTIWTKPMESRKIPEGSKPGQFTLSTEMTQAEMKHLFEDCGIKDGRIRRIDK